MPRASFSSDAVPAFDRALSVVLVVGDVGFFVEEAAASVVQRLAADGAEVLRFGEDTPAESVSDALLNRSLFSPQRVVVFDISGLLGTETPGQLLDQTMEAWEKGTPAGKREAFRRARQLLSSLDLDPGDPEAAAETAARKARKKELAEPLAAILRELPEERGGSAVLTAALRLLLDRENDGTVALLTATAPPSGVDLVEEIAKKGLLLDASISDKKGDLAPALNRLAAARAKEREVVVEPGAIERLRVLTDGNPALFAIELEKLIEWAGTGGRIRSGDVRENVEDEAGEDLYEFYEAVGRRDARDALTRLERIFSGRVVRAGEREIDTEEYWPVRFLGMLAEEVRRMLLARARLEESGRGLDALGSYAAFQARVAPVFSEPVAPFGVSPFAGARGQFSPYPWFKASQRAARFTTRELAAALARAADTDVKLKNSADPLETLTAYVGQLIAGS